MTSHRPVVLLDVEAPRLRYADDVEELALGEEAPRLRYTAAEEELAFAIPLPSCAAVGAPRTMPAQSRDPAIHTSRGVDTQGPQVRVL